MASNGECAIPDCYSLECVQGSNACRVCSPPPPPPPSLPPLAPGQRYHYTISWNATYQTTIEAFPTKAYIANVSSLLGVPASSVSVSVSAGSVVVTTRIGVDNNATEAARIAERVPIECAFGNLGDSCTPPVAVADAIGGGSVTGDPHFRGAHGDTFAFRGGNHTVYAVHSSRHLQVCYLPP